MDDERHTSQSAGYSRAKLDALERRVFTSPFVLVRADNTGGGTVSTRVEARRARTVRDGVATLVGTLVPQLWAVDVDPADTGAEPEAGEAAAEDLVAWCDAHGLPWLLRASGRPGGRHIIARVPADLVRELRQLARQLAGQHGPACVLRRSLRLLTAPHRAGLGAPVLDGTLTASDLPQRDTTATPSAGVPAGRAGRRRQRRDPDTAAGDRSAREFGDAIVRVRAGWGPGRSWAAANVVGSKAAERGELWWRSYVWCVAVTVVAAEDEATEAEAWRRFHRAAPTRARRLGIDEWRETYWRPALAERDTARPRRHHLDRRTGRPKPLRGPDDYTEQQRQTAEMAAALRTAGTQQAQLAGARPQFAHSLDAALAALAEPIVARRGSISTREWAERAQLDPKTLRRVRDFAAEHGILYRAHTYADGAADTDAWQPGPASTAQLERPPETSPTRWDTPTGTQPLGHACPARLRRTHRAERQLWRLRTIQAAETARTGTRFADQQTPAAKTARSVWHQRRWWHRLTPDQQEHRRAHRRALLGAMHRSERTAWLNWLDRRATITAAADRTTHDQLEPADWSILEHAPRTVHLGLRDPAWRHGGTPPVAITAARPHTEQLTLAA